MSEPPIDEYRYFMFGVSPISFAASTMFYCEYVDLLFEECVLLRVLLFHVGRALLFACDSCIRTCGCLYIGGRCCIA